VSFCSRADIYSGQPAAGTGVRAAAYVFLPVPKRLWGARELNDRWASPAELAAIVAARKGGVLVRLYNPPREAGNAPPPILVHAAQPNAPPPALAELLAVFAARWPVEQGAAPARLAVCTQGTRDRCCAKWGYAVYGKALQLFEAGASPHQPIECSHLGGDRFAATGIVFPSGSMYAHLDEADLPTLLADEAAGRLTPATYRGRVFEGPVVQIIRQALAKAGLFDSATAPLQVSRASPEAMEAQVRLPDGRLYRAALAMLDVQFFASCEKLEAVKPATGRRLAVAGLDVVA
jgi:hypothetical protein